MRFTLIVSLLLAAGWSQAAPLPLTAKEISLMLRSGYSNEAIGQDLTTRHFVGPWDDTTRKMLTDAGASSALVNDLANGVYAVPASEIDRVQAEAANQARRRAMEADELRRSNTLYQSQIAQTRSATPGPANSGNTIYPLLKGDLVRWHDGSLVRVEDESLEKKQIYALYFSAHWCGPCRQFTPTLVDYYNRVASQHPEFELIFVSYDRNAFGFQTYMKDMHMPWPAIDYSKLGNKADLKKYAGDSIPDLVLVDSTGRVLSDSFAGKQYLGPKHVLADLDMILTRGAGSEIAQGR